MNGFVRTHLSRGLGFSKEDRDTNVARIAWVASYAAAFAGEIEDFTGVSAPYEEPGHPELRLDTTGQAPADSAAAVLARLAELNLLPAEVEA